MSLSSALRVSLPSRRRWRTAALAATAVVVPLTAVAQAPLGHADTSYAYTLSSPAGVNVGFGADGSIQSLKINGDLFDTQYVMNPDVAPKQAAEPNVKYKQWLGNLMFSYAFGSGQPSVNGVGSTPWSTAWTTESSDARTVTSDGSSVTVTYQNSSSAQGVKGFTLVEKYSLDATGGLVWSQTVKNASGQQLNIGDWGVPLPGNELFTEGDELYETRVLQHSYVANNGSYVTLQRPSGQGPSLLISPDTATGSGFQYLDRWRVPEVGNTPWADTDGNIKGLEVYYPYSMAIQKTGRGYLPSTSLGLAPGASKTLTYHIAKVTSDDNRKDTLYNQGLLDSTVVPSLVVPYDQTARMAFRVKGAITSVTAKNLNDSAAAAPTSPAIRKTGTNGVYQLYSATFDKTQLGNNQFTVQYTDAAGRPRSTVLFFWVIAPVGTLLDQHAQFMTDKMQWTPDKDSLPGGDVRSYTFDDWLMNSSDGSRPTDANPPAGRRNAYFGYWGLGDDWGLTHGTFLAEKNVLTPVKSQVQALDNYLEKAVWENLMGNTADTAAPKYLIYDFWEQGKLGSANDTPAYRGYAYPHIYNTFFAMYQIAKQNPQLIGYAHPAQWYLNVAYNVFKTMYDGPVTYNWYTGTMGEQTTPQLIDALKTEKMNAQAGDVMAKMAVKYKNFSGAKYPYGSEYSYDNTGEEAVYTLARMNVNNDQSNALRMMQAIVEKTRASRGQAPVWYQYADPVGINGEVWWQFQYTAALAGYGMDDYINHTSALETGANAVSSSDRAMLERLNYAGKLANLTAVNSGQISPYAGNIGASAWTYQAEKGNLGTLGLGGGDNVQLLNGWRGMTGESDLGLWGALQTISTDVVTDDPIFGTVAYGGSVRATTDGSAVTPSDGVQRRLNMVTQQLSIDLASDKYTKAVISKANDGIQLTMANVTGAAHQGSFSVSGLKLGTYAVVVNGQRQGKVNIYNPNPGTLTSPATVAYQAPAGSSFVVKLVAADPRKNKAPVVDAGPDQSGLTVGLDPVKLSGSVTDDGLGSPNGTLTSQWSVASTPAGATATFDDAASLTPTVTVDKAGQYTFTLTASDGQLTSKDTVTVTLVAPVPMPKNWVAYTFDSATPSTVPDTTGNGNDLTLNGKATVGLDGSDTVLKLDGSDGTYGQLPADIVSRATGGLTISMRAKVNDVVTFTRLFDFGSGTQSYVFLSPSLGDGKLGLGITKTGNGPGSQTISTTYAVTAGTWMDIKVTFARNADGTTTGTIYVNGTQVGQNSSLTLSPSDLGRTTSDYIGKSQYGDPLLNGEVDSFAIHGDVE